MKNGIPALTPATPHHGVDESVEVPGRADDRVGDCFQVGVPADVAGLRRRLESAHQSVMMGAGELVVERIAIQRVVTTAPTAMPAVSAAPNVAAAPAGILTLTDVGLTCTNSVELRGIEPLTFSMRTRRATNCATAPCRVT